MGNLKSFEDLDCWKKSTELRRKVSKLIKGFPSDEKFLLIDQLKRASRSVTNNIAEGYGRFHFKENIQFCRQSRGSIYEVKDHLINALDEEYITKNIFQSFEEDINECLAILNGYINYLKKNLEG
jgi:four helix bundle protein